MTKSRRVPIGAANISYNIPLYVYLRLKNYARTNHFPMAKAAEIALHHGLNYLGVPAAIEGLGGPEEGKDG